MIPTHLSRFSVPSNIVDVSGRESAAGDVATRAHVTPVTGLRCAVEKLIHFAPTRKPQREGCKGCAQHGRRHVGTLVSKVTDRAVAALASKRQRKRVHSKAAQRARRADDAGLLLRNRGWPI